MKVLLRISALIVVAVCLAMFFFGFFGYRSYYGDITTTIINSAEDISPSSDFKESLTVGFEAADDAALSEADLDAVAACFRQRLSFFDLADYSVEVDYGSGKVWVNFPESDISDGIISYLTLDIGFEVHKGLEQTEGTLILDASGVKTADANYVQGSSSYYYTMELRLTDEAKAAYAAATEELSGEYEASGETQFVSFWFNDSLLESVNVRSAENSGIILIDQGLSATTVDQMSVILGSMQLPAAMNATDYYTEDASLGEGALD
ncbi:MAG: hypothetical protein Q4B42_04445, partial [Oscillospiraceae bacterium]|nr:hypothetical protein [Oscillospiraceae bacterium]